MNSEEREVDTQYIVTTTTAKRELFQQEIRKKKTANYLANKRLRLFEDLDSPLQKKISIHMQSQV